MATSAMELQVLIKILQDGGALKTLLADTKSLASALTGLQTQSKQGGVEQSVKSIGDAGKEATAGMESLNRAMEKAVSTVKFLAGGFLALETVRFIKDLADTAARAEVLQTVLHVVGNNAAYSSEQLDKVDRQIQSLGITATASRQSLTQFVQAGFDLPKAGELAKAAQDAAVILGTNSSEAFTRLVTAVQTSNTHMLRYMGIIVNADIAYQKFASSIGKTTPQLTLMERSQAFLNATLEQTAKIQGSYTAAMGDVGKQLTSLDRLTENLERSIGNNLLPAYLALVQELSSFLEELKLTSDEMYGQGEGAKTLGDDVRFLAHWLHELLSVVVEYRRELFVLIAGWAALRYAILPIIQVFSELKVALVGGELAASAGTISRFVAVVRGAIPVIIEWAEGLGGVGTTIVEILSGPIGWIILAVTALVAALRLLTGSFNFITEPIKKVWQVLSDLVTVAEDINNWFVNKLTPTMQTMHKWVLGLASALGDQLSDGFERARIKAIALWTVLKNIPGPVKDAVDAAAKLHEMAEKAAKDQAARPVTEESHQAALREQEKLIGSILTKTRERNMLEKIGSAEDVAKADKELKEMTDRQKVLEEARQGAQDALKYTPAQRETENKKIEQVKADAAAREIANELEEARKGSKFTYTKEGGEIGNQFSLQLSQLASLMKGYSSAADHAGVTTAELVRNLRDAGQQTKTKAELVELATSAEKLAKTPGLSLSDIAEANLVVATARLQVRQAEQQERAAVVADQVRQAKDRTDDAVKQAQVDLDGTKTRTANELNVLEDGYKNGNVLLDKYYAERRRIVLENSTAEATLEGAKLVQLQAQKAVGGQDPKALSALDDQIDAAKERMKVAKDTTKNDLDKLDLEEKDRREALILELKQTLLTQQVAAGSQEAGIKQINLQLEEEKKKYGALADPLVKQLLVLESITKEYDRQKTLREQAYKDEDAVLKLKEDQLKLVQDQQDVEAAKDKALVAKGVITQSEATRRDNARIEQSQQNNRAQYALKEQELQEQKVRSLMEEMALRIKLDALRAVGLVTDEDEKRQLEEQRIAAQDAQTQIESTMLGLDKAYADMAASMTSTGQELAKSISDSISKSIADAIVNFRSAKDIFKSLAESIANDMVSALTKPFLQALTSKVAGFLTKLLAGGGTQTMTLPIFQTAAEGGPISGPGTGTSDSIPAMLSAGEHVMPAAKAAQWMPLLEGIRLGKIMPAYALGGVVSLQSIAIPSLIPRRYANGGVVVSDGGASAVTPGMAGPGNMIVSLHPDALQMTMREWLENEVVRQQGRR